MQCAPVIDAGREWVFELKFYVAEQDCAGLLRWVRSHLAPDPYGTGAHGDCYQVSSLYLDTLDHAVLARRGSYARSKYRVRRYNGSPDTLYLERKTRGQYRVFKRRAALPAPELEGLHAPVSRRGWGGYWFHRRLLARGLLPVCRVDYQRIARIGQGSYGPLRLTLDEDLLATAVHDLTFDVRAGSRGLSSGRRILELKFGCAMPAVFKQLIREFAPQLSGISKYRLAARSLRLAPGLVTSAEGGIDAAGAARAAADVAPGGRASEPFAAPGALTTSTY